MAKKSEFNIDNTAIETEATETDAVENKETETVDSEAIVAEKKAKLEAKRAERAAAKERVRVFLKGLNVEVVEDMQLKTDITLLIGTGRKATGEAKVSINSLIKEQLIKEEFISEMDIFMTYKIGRPEMKIKERLFVKNSVPEERVWMTFNEDKEGYELAGLGATAPEGWDGFLPADLVTL